MFHITHRSETLLLITAMIWGFAFVAQSSGMEYLGPFSFNGIRFILGATALLPLLYFFSQKSNKNQSINHSKITHSFIDKTHLTGGLLMGFILFIAASLQQIGLLYTSVANAGFITSLYIILVPLIKRLLGHRIHFSVWIGAVLAIIGLYLLSFKGDFSISYGDLLQLIGAIFWALHIIVIGKFSPKTDAIKLSIMQFSVCGIASLATGFIIEVVELSAILKVLPELLYLGVLSTSVAYTLQVVAQKKVAPENAALIFSLEAVFALLGGWAILNESISTRGLIGCSLMFVGVIISQHYKAKNHNTKTRA
jgi:drug/metabolite transporter (DMT)-like permease